MTLRTAASGGARPSPGRTVLGTVVMLAGAVLTLVVGAAPAAAHNVLTGTKPALSSSVGRTPAQVVLTFDQPAVAMGTQVLVTGPSGQVQTGTARLVDKTVVQDVQRGAPAGAYTVAWRVTSADGHPVSGTFTFTSSEAGAGTPPSPLAAGPPTAAAPTSQPADSRSWPRVAGAAALVAVLAGVVVLLVRRRRP